MDGPTDGCTDGRLEIHPCVLQDIDPFGPLPKKVISRLPGKWRKAALTLAPYLIKTNWGNLMIKDL